MHRKQAGEIVREFVEPKSYFTHSRPKVFNKFVQNAVEKSQNISVSDSPKRRFNTLHRSEGWHFRGGTRGQLFFEA
jgi:hypothetical protein